MNIFKGRTYLKFEKYPDYTNGNDRLVRVLLNLHFTKLVLRVRATGYKEGFVSDFLKCVPEISPLIRGNLYKTDEEVFEGYNQALPSDSIHSQFPLFAYNYTGDFLGSIEDLRWFVKYDCVVTDCPKGVVFSRTKNAYIGYSHRGAQAFEIGQKLFDPDQPIRERDFTPERWAEIVKYREDTYKRELKEGYVDNREQFDFQSPISGFVKFIERGAKTITNMTESKQAAKRFADYVS